MSTFPFGNIIAVWIALEDITPENGPLHYYPGSHRLPYIVNSDYDNIGTKYSLGDKTYGDYEDRIQEEIDSQKLTKQTFLAKKGDLLIWHANLLHGGEPLIDKNSTRKSMVFHYYAEDVICYHEITQRPTLKKKI
jgi:ectoine hydroxylase-related dioxygenase (phytanoyl-CoA dioxygenase family)